MAQQGDRAGIQHIAFWVASSGGQREQPTQKLFDSDFDSQITKAFRTIAKKPSVDTSIVSKKCAAGDLRPCLIIWQIGQCVIDSLQVSGCTDVARQ